MSATPCSLLRIPHVKPPVTFSVRQPAAEFGEATRTSSVSDIKCRGVERNSSPANSFAGEGRSVPSTQAQSVVAAGPSGEASGSRMRELPASGLMSGDGKRSCHSARPRLYKSVTRSDIF
jgi:hypothetical protein